MNLAELTREMLRLSRVLDEGIHALSKAGRDLATAEHTYRKSVAVAWAHAPKGTVPEREAWVQGETADKRLDRDLAESERQTALEATRSRRTQLSALQTVANAVRAEAEVGVYGPDLGAVG